MKLTTTEFSFNASLSCIDLGHIAESMEEINQSRIKSLHYDMAVSYTHLTLPTNREV